MPEGVPPEPIAPDGRVAVWPRTPGKAVHFGWADSGSSFWYSSMMPPVSSLM